MAGGRGTGGAADTAGMAADGTGIIDSVLQFRQVSDKVANPFEKTVVSTGLFVIGFRYGRVSQAK
jgi:hypothetical protein